MTTVREKRKRALDAILGGYLLATGATLVWAAVTAQVDPPLPADNTDRSNDAVESDAEKTEG